MDSGRAGCQYTGLGGFSWGLAYLKQTGVGSMTEQS